MTLEGLRKNSRKSIYIFFSAFFSSNDITHIYEEIVTKTKQVASKHFEVITKRSRMSNLQCDILGKPSFDLFSLAVIKKSTKSYILR